MKDKFPMGLEPYAVTDENSPTVNVRIESYVFSYVAEKYIII